MCGLNRVEYGYRTINAFGTTSKECVKDGKTAMRWVRTHAAELGIDPSRILAGGGSAGGHIAAATALVSGFNEVGEDRLNTVAVATCIFTKKRGTVFSISGWIETCWPKP
jgi:hypothetical protein